MYNLNKESATFKPDFQMAQSFQRLINEEPLKRDIIMLSLILKKLNEEKAIYEFHPNADANAEYGMVELDRKSNVATVKEHLQGGEWYTVHALNKLEEYGSLNSFPKEETLYWY